MEAMAKEGARLIVTAAGRRRRHRSTIPMALVTNLVTRIQVQGLPHVAITPAGRAYLAGTP